MEHKVLEYPCLNIIYDSRRIEKYPVLMDELFRQGIDNFMIWPCVMLKTVVDSIAASHKMIVKYAKDSGLKEVCIAEDDLWFPASDGWDYYIRNKPERYHIYLGGNYLPINKEKKVCTDITGLHLYMISAEFYDEFLELPFGQHIDTSLKDRSVFHCCYPFAALQRPGFSANNLREVDYNTQIDWNDVYHD